ncbi:hypothetical protein PMAYCL1PPCAC_26516, partial [Pristionchus mayeri]
PTTMNLLSILTLALLLSAASAHHLDDDSDHDLGLRIDRGGRGRGATGGRGNGGRLSRVRPGAESLQFRDTPIRPDPFFNFFDRRL